MRFGKRHAGVRIKLRLPVLMLVIAATAIPIELRPWASNTFDFKIFPTDLVANIAGYVPVGLVLAELGFTRALLLSALLTTFTETGQHVMAHRDPSIVDIAANILGAALGAAMSRHWKWRTPELHLAPRQATMAAMAAIVVGLISWIMWGDPENSRGLTATGALEGYWKVDESEGTLAIDSSGHGLNGHLRGSVSRLSGMRGTAAMFKGAEDRIDIRSDASLRLFGSMTISAWINSTAFPADDAVVVSHRGGGYGYQLDTTIDTGNRTLGFKLTNACGDLMTRYGATTLLPNTWYHAAGVYDAKAKTLDVYLDGRPDNGRLDGVVTGSQRSSRGATYIGQRMDLRGFGFQGLIDDIRLYSKALTQEEIIIAIRGEDTPPAAPSASATPRSLLRDNIDCALSTEPEEAKIPAVAAVLGMLITCIVLGLWPTASRAIAIGASVVGGVWFSTLLPRSLPQLDTWLIPLTSLAACVSVLVSQRRIE